MVSKIDPKLETKINDAIKFGFAKPSFFKSLNSRSFPQPGQPFSIISSAFDLVILPFTPNMRKNIVIFYI